MQKQYEAYLTRVGLVESQMHPQQRIETKRAFYGGLGVMLSIIWERPDQFAREMLNMSNQIQNFWDNETLNHLTGNNG